MLAKIEVYMNWGKFAIGCVALLIVIFLGIFLVNRTSENRLTKELERIQNSIASRNDGSSLIYDELETNLDDVQFSRIIYQDGSNGGRFALFDVTADLNRNGFDKFTASRLEWINGAGNLITLNNIELLDVEKNQNPTHSWNEYLFSKFIGENLTLEGVTQSNEPIVLKAENISLSDFTSSALESASIENVDIRYTPELAAHLDLMRAENLDYGEVDEIINTVEAGYIPINTIAALTDAEITMQGLEVELDGETVVGRRNGNIDETRMLQLFLDHAPRELQDILGTDARQLQNYIQRLGEQDPNDVAIGALQMMIDLLNENTENKQ